MSSYRLAIHHADVLDASLLRAWSLEDLRLAVATAPLAELGVLEEAEAAALAAAQAAERTRREAELARAERDAALAEAFERGLDAGRLEGERAEAARLRGAVRAAELALAEVREHEERWLTAIEPNVAALAIAVARLVIGRELRTEPAIVADVVRAALAELPIDQPVRVRVHPADLEALAAGGAHAALVEGRDANWVADATLVPGGCLVEGRERIVDGRVDTALERLYRRLTYLDD